MTPVTLLTLTISTGTGTATYRYADVQTDAYPGYAPRLARGTDLEEAAASPLTRSLPVRRARVVLSNVVQPDYTATAPTVSEMLAAGAAVVGAQATVQIADADTQTVLTTLAGYVEEVPALSLSEATLVVSDALAGDASTLLPHCALTDLFPSVQAPDGTALAVILGTARRVRLYRVSQSDVLKVDVAGPSTRNVERATWVNYALPASDRITFAAGDRFVVELWRGQSNFYVALIPEFNRAPNHNDPRWRDQNGYHTAGRIGETLGCMGWYRRVVPVPDYAVGATLTRWHIAGVVRWTRPGSVSGKLARAHILAATGRTKMSFIPRDTENPVKVASGNGGWPGSTVTAAVDPDAGYGFGAWRTATGVTVANAYLNGRRMEAGEYRIVEALPGVGALKLTERPGDDAVVHADFTSTEFAENPATVTRFFLSDATHGLGRRVDEASFTAAARAIHTSRFAQTTGRQIAVGGAVTHQTPAAELLREFLLHGAVLTHGATGTIGIEIDAPGTQATLELGHNDDTGWRNFTPTNAAPVRAADQTRSLLVRGVFDPGFEGEPERWLATTKRSRTAPRGADREVVYRYVADHTSLDRQAHYLWEQMQAWATRLTGDLDVTEPGAYGLNVGDRLVVTVPGLGLDRADYRLAAFQHRGATLSLTLHPYRAAAFTYAAGTDQTIDPLAHTLIDYRRTRPATPTITAATANAPVSIADDREEITISAAATAPAANVEALVFRAVRTGSAATRSEQVVSCTPGQTGVSATLLVDPNLGYTIQVYARNQTNDPDFQLSVAATRSVTSLGSVPTVEDGADGEDGGGTEFIFARTATANSPTLPNNTWAYDRPRTPWSDGLPTLSATHPYGWMCVRKIEGTSRIDGENWSSPRIAFRYGADGSRGPQGFPGARGAKGLQGDDGEGREYIFCLHTADALPSSQHPSNSWGFDQPGSRGGKTWTDAAPNLTETNRYLFWSQRAITGSPRRGASVSGSWSTPRVLAHWGRDGRQGLPGTPGVDAQPTVGAVARHTNSVTLRTSNQTLVTFSAGNLPPNGFYFLLFEAQLDVTSYRGRPRIVMEILDAGVVVRTYTGETSGATSQVNTAIAGSSGQTAVVMAAGAQNTGTRSRTLSVRGRVSVGSGVKIKARSLSIIATSAGLS